MFEIQQEDYAIADGRKHDDLIQCCPTPKRLRRGSSNFSDKPPPVASPLHDDNSNDIMENKTDIQVLE